jgi:hypothetical protein
MARVCSHQQRCGRLHEQAKPEPLPQLGIPSFSPLDPPTYHKTGAIISSSPNGLDHHLDGLEWLVFAHTSKDVVGSETANRVPRLHNWQGIPANPLSNGT